MVENSIQFCVRKGIFEGMIKRCYNYFAGFCNIDSERHDSELKE